MRIITAKFGAYVAIGIVSAVSLLFITTCGEPPAPRDTSPPASITLEAGARTGGDIRITWTDPTTADFSHILITRTPAEGSEQPIRVEKNIEQADITGLTDGVIYTFTAVSVDNAGNHSPSSAPVEITADATPPMPVSNLVATGGPSQATLTWTDPGDSDLARILITWTSTAGDSTQPLEVASGIETATITALTPGEYTFTVVSVDAVGHQSLPGTGTATSRSDGTPPGLVVLAAAARADGSIEVTWTDPDDTDFSHILLSWTSVGGAVTPPLAIPSGTQTATIPGLTDGTEYTFTAKSVDVSGNLSADSAAVQATADSTPPEAVVLAATAQTGGSVEVNLDRSLATQIFRIFS